MSSLQAGSTPQGSTNRSFNCTAANTADSNPYFCGRWGSLGQSLEMHRRTRTHTHTTHVSCKSIIVQLPSEESQALGFRGFGVWGLGALGFGVLGFMPGH